MADHEQQRQIWDPLPVADTRPAMKAGVPYWLIFPVFFGPCIVLVITGNLFWFVMIPVLWSRCSVGIRHQPEPTLRMDTLGHVRIVLFRLAHVGRRDPRPP